MSPFFFPVELRSLEGEAAERLPRTTMASIVGPEDAPIVVALGGISATCAVTAGPGGEPGWWNSLFGAGRWISTDRYRILGIDFVADDGGSFAPDTFDQAGIITDALQTLGEREAAAIVGASYGGMVALACAQRFGLQQTRLVILCAGAAPHPMATAQRSLQRRVVRMGVAQGCPDEALAIARGMAMLTYRTRREFGERFKGGIRGGDPLAPCEPHSYLDARGRHYVRTTMPGRFLSLSASIDRHRIDPASIACPTLVIGVDEDQVVPLDDSASLAARLGGPATFRALSSIFGHDAFLKEPEMFGPPIADFLNQPAPPPQLVTGRTE